MRASRSSTPRASPASTSRATSRRSTSSASRTSARTPPSSHAATGASSKWCAGAELGPSSDPRRELLLTLLQAALDCVDGRRCVREALEEGGAGEAPESPGPVWLAAVGKAAAAMALGAYDA